MIKEMMGAGLPINKDAVLDMSRSLTSYPHNSISTMVEMKSLGIPITQNNLTQFESYKNYEHQVTSAMENIMDELPEAFNQPLQLRPQGSGTDCKPESKESWGVKYKPGPLCLCLPCSEALAHLCLCIAHKHRSFI